MERRILVVEDTPTQAEHLRLLLEGAGYRVDLSRNGREGLARVRVAPPDLVISDIVIPQMDGFAFCRAVKSSPAAAGLPFVLLTERSTALDILKGLEAGADNFITKPFEDDILLDRVRRIFEHLRLREQGRLEVEVALRVGERQITINADKQQIVELLFSTFEELCRLNSRLADSQRIVEEYARTLEAKVAERTGELRSLFDGIPVGLFRSTPDGQLLDANPAMVQMVGYADLPSLTAVTAAARYVDPEDRRRWQAVVDRDGIVSNFEARLRRRDGSAFWARITARVVRDASGLALHYEGAAQDITARKRAEEALAARAREQAAVAGLGQRALVVTDLRALLSEGVALIAETLGVECADVLELLADGRELVLRAGVGWPDGSVGHVTVGPGSDSQAGYTLQANQAVIANDVATETRFVVPPLLRERGVVSGLTVVIRGQARTFGVLGAHACRPRAFTSDDVHFLETVASVLGMAIERRRSEEALLQAEKVAAMGELLAGVAHELNNPLSVVLGQATLLRNATGAGPLGARAEKIVQAAERCGRVVRNFLALARQRPVERQTIQLNRVVEEAVELLAYPLRVDSVEVTLDLAPEVPALWADPDQLHQVLVNLLTNAHHALRNRSSPRRITISTRVDPGRSRVHLAVTDNGPGMPPEIQGRIFEPFFTTKPPGQGTGLGLSLCAGIVATHGGSIGVESVPGHGSTFRIEVPVEAPRGDRTPGGESTVAPPIRGKAILVVDDETEVGTVLAEVLAADGHRVDTVADGIAALAKLSAGPYDLILSDLRMPELDGPGLYREVEQRHPELRQRFVFLTGDTLSPEAREFLERLGAPSLSKPFSLEEVRQVVRKALWSSG